MTRLLKFYNTEKFDFFCQDFTKKNEYKSTIKGCLPNLQKIFSFHHMTHCSVPLFEVGFVFTAYKNRFQFPVWWNASKNSKFFLGFPPHRYLKVQLNLKQLAIVITQGVSHFPLDLVSQSGAPVSPKDSADFWIFLDFIPSWARKGY